MADSIGKACPSWTVWRATAARLGAGSNPARGFDWQGTTYASLSAIARAITGTAWSGPRFFALAPRNGTSARGNNKRSVRVDRNGSQPAAGLSKGISLALANSVSCVTPEP